MTPRAKTAYARLSAIAALLLLIAMFACRPAWSPDGKRLLFASRIDDDRQAIAVYDRDSDTAEVLFQPQANVAGVPLWTADGTHAVILTGGKQQTCEVAIVPVTVRGPVRRFDVDLADDALIVPPVLLGRRLFVGGKTIASIDIDSGAATEVLPAIAGKQYVVVAAGNGLGYVRGDAQQHDQWEIGRIDVDTHRTTALLHDDPELPWVVSGIPSFSPDGSRMALLGQSRTERQIAIVVFADGKFETALPIEGEAQLGTVAWAPDSARLFATLTRHDEDGLLAWNLVETMVGGSVTREMAIATSKANRRLRRSDGLGMAMQVALSPDGKLAALSTAFIEHMPAEQHGLYLVDLTGEHKVRRLPFPAPPAPQVVLVGSDTMLQLADAWSTAFADTHADMPISVNGGGSTQGLTALLDGDASMLAMSTRPARPAELAAAQRRGLQVTGHRVAFAALAIGVHKDNPMTEVTVPQLAAVFGANGTTRWTDLGVAMPGGQEAIRAVGTRGTVYQLPFQKAALAGRPLGEHVESLAASEVVALLGTTPNAIGIVPCDLADPAVKLLAVAGKAGDAAVLPSTGTIADGSYPLAQPQFLYRRAEPSPAVNAFLQWLASDAGKQATARAGFVPAD